MCDNLPVAPDGETGNSMGRHLFIIMHNRSMASCGKGLHSIDYKHNVPALLFADVILAAQQRIGWSYPVGRTWLSLCAGTQSDSMPVAAAAGMRYVPMDLLEVVAAHSDRVMNFQVDLSSDDIVKAFKAAVKAPESAGDEVLLQIGFVHIGLPCETHSVTNRNRRHRGDDGAPLAGPPGDQARTVDKMMDAVKGFIERVRGVQRRCVGVACGCGRRRS